MPGFCWSCILGSLGPLKVWVNSAPRVILKMTSMIPYVSEVIEHPFIIIRRIWLLMPRDKYLYTHTVSIHLLIFYEIYHGKSPVFHHDWVFFTFSKHPTSKCKLVLSILNHHTLPFSEGGEGGGHTGDVATSHWDLLLFACWHDMGEEDLTKWLRWMCCLCFFSQYP